MITITIMPPTEIATALAAKLRERRLSQGLTQEGLSRRSGVALGTLKKFERSGQISLVSFIRLMVALKEEGALEQFLNEQKIETLDQVLTTAKKAKRGRIK